MNLNWPLSPILSLLCRSYTFSCHTSQIIHVTTYNKQIKLIILFKFFFTILVTSFSLWIAIDAKLQTATSSLLEYCTISVHRLDQRVVPSFCWFILFSISWIFIQHIWNACFHLGFNNGKPQILCLYLTNISFFCFIAAANNVGDAQVKNLCL